MFLEDFNYICFLGCLYIKWTFKEPQSSSTELKMNWNSAMQFWADILVITGKKLRKNNVHAEHQSPRLCPRSALMLDLWSWAVLCRALLQKHSWPERRGGFGGEGMKAEMSSAELWLLFAAGLWACCACAASATAVFLMHAKKCWSTCIKITVIRM